MDQLIENKRPQNIMLQRFDSLTVQTWQSTFDFAFKFSHQATKPQNLDK